MDNEYLASLAKKTLDEMRTELEEIDQQLDILFTMQNSLEGMDLTEGGGTPESQAKYKELVRHQDILNSEIQKREMLELLG